MIELAKWILCLVKAYFYFQILYALLMMYTNGRR